MSLKQHLLHTDYSAATGCSLPCATPLLLRPVCCGARVGTADPAHPGPPLPDRFRLAGQLLRHALATLVLRPGTLPGRHRWRAWLAAANLGSISLVFLGSVGPQGL